MTAQLFVDMKQNKALSAHLCIFGACAIWGLMSPVGKDAMIHGITGLDMVAFRTSGAAVLFWVTSMFVKSEHVQHRDLLRLAGAAMLGVVFNQCCFTIGLSLTSPINASITTTTMPIFTLVLAAIFLHEPITVKKFMGIVLGATGAILLILGSARSGNGREGNVAGDLLVLTAQFSYASYLSIFKPLIQRYSVVTIMKWMFLYAALVTVPLASYDLASLEWSQVAMATWLDTAFVVVGGTFVAYILCVYAQQILRPTVISTYNYVQPLVATIVSVTVGLATFGLQQSVAVVLVFAGVWLVTKSKSRADVKRMKKESRKVS